MTLVTWIWLGEEEGGGNTTHSVIMIDGFSKSNLCISPIESKEIAKSVEMSL